MMAVTFYGSYGTVAALASLLHLKNANTVGLSEFRYDICATSVHGRLRATRTYVPATKLRIVFPCSVKL